MMFYTRVIALWCLLLFCNTCHCSDFSNMADKFKAFLRLIEKWPIDALKYEQDLGLHLRTKLSQSFKSGAQPIDEAKNDETCKSLDRLINNVHGDKYKRSKENSRFAALSTDTSAEDLRKLYAEALKLGKEKKELEDKGGYEMAKYKLKNMIPFWRVF